MICYDGTYRMREPGNKRARIAGKWIYAWRVRIIDLSLSQPDVKHLKPIIVVANQENKVFLKANCAESMGKRICRDFNLNVSDIRWVEYFHDDPRNVYVATFTPKSYFGNDIFYAVNWRPARPNELAVIRFFIPEIGHL